MESTLLNFENNGCATVPVCNYNIDPKHPDNRQALSSNSGKP